MMSPTEMLNRVRATAKLDTKEFEKSIAVKLNKSGKIKLQFLALDEDYLFRARTQHFIPTLPDNEDPNEKIMVVDCQGDNCPICDAALAFKNSGVTVEAVNDAYKPKYPYQKLRNVLTQPEHFLLGVRVLADQADEGTYLPKEESVGSTQLLQLSKSALNSLMSAYEDFISDYEDDIESLPPLFGIVEKGKDKVKSFSVNLRIQTQPWSYNFTFGKSVEVNVSDIDIDKLKLLEEAPKPTEDYVEKAIKRIHDLQNWFTGMKNTASVTTSNNSTTSTGGTDLDSILDDSDDLDLDDIDKL